MKSRNAIRGIDRMALTAEKWRIVSATTLMCACVGLAGCGGTDVHIDAPILEAAGINLTAKKADEDIPERSGIVIPPSTDKLPEPGSRTAAANAPQNWPQDADQAKASKAEAEAKARDEYCRERKWAKENNISEFEKDTGDDEQRCASSLGKAISKAFGGGEATQQ